jgi:hypothetical protein
VLQVEEEEKGFSHIRDKLTEAESRLREGGNHFHQFHFKIFVCFSQHCTFSALFHRWFLK